MTLKARAFTQNNWATLTSHAMLVQYVDEWVEDRKKEGYTVEVLR